MKYFCVILLSFTITKLSAQWSVIFETGTVFGLQDVSAVNDNVAWATMTSDSVYKTIDGGTTWDRIGLTDLETDYQVSNIYALNEDVAFLCGQVIFTGFGPGIIYRTNDGGITWENVLEIDSNCTFTMHMKDETTGVVAVFKTTYTGSTSCSFLKTTDGGYTWSYDGVTEPADFFAFDNDNLFAKGDELWVCDIDGNLHYSNDLGNSWDEIFSATFTNTLSIPAFENALYGVAGGKLSFTDRLFRTTDGEEFEEITDALSFNVENTVIHDEEIWYTINPAIDITVYYSSDSGETFNPQYDNPSGIKEMTPSRNGFDIWALTAFGEGKIIKYENLDDVGVVAFTVSNDSLCSGTCISFSDLSTNFPVSWQWIFDGALTASSTDENPTEICYDGSGNFDVTLITTNAEGVSDTLFMPDYITVYEAVPPVITIDGNLLSSSEAATYQWYFNGILIDDATEQNYTATETGIYSVVITDISGCTSEASVNVTIAGLTSFEINSIKLYPNPANDVIIIEDLISDDKEINLIDLNGKILGHYYFNETTLLSVENLLAGIYILEITSDDDITRLRFIKE